MYQMVLQHINQPLYINATVKWIGSVLQMVADERVYCRTVTGVYVGLNHESETEMIFKVQYDHQYEEDLAVLFPKKEYSRQRLYPTLL